MIRFAGLTALVALSGLPAHAFEFGSGLYAKGSLHVESLNANDQNDTFTFSQLELGFRPEGSPFGGYVAFDGLAFEDDSVSTLWGALVYSNDLVAAQIGAPWPVIDDYFSVPDLAGAKIYTQELRSGSSFLTYSYPGNDGVNPVGMRVDVTQGGLAAGVSVHEWHDIKFTDAAVRYGFGATTVSAAAERVEQEGAFSATVTHLGAETSIDKLRLGAITTDQDNGQKVNQLYAVYSLTDAVSVTGQYVNLTSPYTSLDIWAVTGTYTLSQNLSADIGYVQTDDDYKVYTAALSARF